MANTSSQNEGNGSNLKDNGINMPEPRKVCKSCNKPLIAFQGQFLHVEEPCPGILDCINIEATISDEALHDKFLELYGTPELDDYERIALLEAEIEILSKRLDNPLVKLILRYFK